MKEKVDDLKKRLTPEQFAVTQEAATEPPGSGEYLHNKEKGMYKCIVCNAELFESGTKFDSGTGWPSFDSPANRENVELKEDSSHGMRRTEVICKNCGAHLGHLFPDGPTTTGDRYCINSCALKFQSSDEK